MSDFMWNPVVRGSVQATFYAAVWGVFSLGIPALGVLVGMIVL